ncbi:hypothetical protein AB0942_06620, partial [Streptomyces nodosus]|uniref:hypothetical protein n=1 Tax=Streptomyces nodosus TaxID=40318 RepID=UPI003454CD08
MPGTVLLLAASPAGKGRLVDAASVLPVLAAVAPSVLSGTDTANVVELADPIEPQAVLTRLRAAAAVPDPLTVFLVGQLQLDRRQRQPHLALARTTPATVRYTAFPWQWIREELRLRPPGTTTVFADLHADAESWRRLATEPLDCGPTVLLLGRVAPPPSRRAPALPGYMKALATILRSGRRPEPTVLHHDALTRAYAETSGNRGDIVLTPGGPVPSWYAPAPYSGPGPSGFHGHGHGPEGPLPAAAPSAVTPAPPHHGAGPLSFAAPDPDAAAVTPAAPASYGRRPGRPARDPSGPPATPLTAAPERSAPVGAPSGGAPEPSDLRGRGPGGSAAGASNVRAVPSPVAPERSASGGAPSVVAPEPSDLNGRRSARPSPAVPALRTAPPADGPTARAAPGLPPGGPTPGSSAPDPTPLAAVPARPDPHTVPLTVVPPPSDADLGASAPYAAPPAIRPRSSAPDAAPSAVASTPSSPYTVPAVVPAPSAPDPGAPAPYAALPAVVPAPS